MCKFSGLLKFLFQFQVLYVYAAPYTIKIDILFLLKHLFIQLYYNSLQYMTQGPFCYLVLARELISF